MIVSLFRLRESLLIGLTRSLLPASNATELRSWIEEAIELFLSFQQEDGYINAYILTVSEVGPFENIRDLHEVSLRVEPLLRFQFFRSFFIFL